MTSRWLAFAIALMACALAHAETSGRKVVDPTSVLYGHIAGELTIPGKPHLTANAFFVGVDGCHILSNYHVVFADSVDPVTEKVNLVKPRSVRAAGYEVEFAFDLDGSTGKFRRRAKAVAIELGGYEDDTTEGLTQDMVLLRLKPCAGKAFAGPNLDHPEPLEFVPQGKLTTISTSRKDNGINELLVETGCTPGRKTTIAGVFYSDCHIEPGMSGSMILETSTVRKSRLVGISTSVKKFDDGSVISIAIHSSSITPFIESVLGLQRPPAMAPVAKASGPRSSAQTPKRDRTQRGTEGR